MLGLKLNHVSKRGPCATHKWRHLPHFNMIIAACYTSVYFSKSYSDILPTKKYEHGSCFVMHCCGWILIDLPISFRFLPPALGYIHMHSKTYRKPLLSISNHSCLAMATKLVILRCCHQGYFKCNCQNHEQCFACRYCGISSLITQ